MEQVLVFKLQIKFTSTWKTQLKTYAPLIPHLSFCNRCKNSDDEKWSDLYLSHIHKINNHFQKVLSETLQKLGTSLQQYLFRENWFNWIKRFGVFLNIIAHRYIRIILLGKNKQNKTNQINSLLGIILTPNFAYPFQAQS